MNKKIIIVCLAVFFSVTGFNIVNAADTNTKGNVEINRPQKPPFGEFKGPQHGNFDAPPPEHFKGAHPTKEEMEAKKAEIDKRLKLTDKQKKQIELNKQQDRIKMKPIMDDIHAKKQEFREIIENDNLSQAEKDKKLKEVKESMRELKSQADALRKENMDNFESVLTEKQKKEFAKIKEEQKKDMEQRKKEFEKTVIPPQKK